MADTNLRQRRRRLLVISYHFIPDGAVGGLRWAGLSKYLARRGWEVHVITAAAQDGQPSVPGVHIHHVPRVHTLNDRYNEWSRRRGASGNAPVEASDGGAAPAPEDIKRAPVFRQILWALRSEVADSLAFPDIARGWIIRATFKARTLLMEHDFDAVVSSGPPHSAHLVGTLAVLGHGRRLTVDMRDPLASGREPFFVPLLFASSDVGILIRKLERLAFGRAKRVIANTPEFAEVLRDRVPGLGVTAVQNGVDLERIPLVPTTKYDGLSIAYAGALYLDRDLAPVLHALRELFDGQPCAQRDIKLRVAGWLSPVNAARFHQQVAETRLEDSVEALGKVSPAVALDLVRRSHLALVLAQHQPWQIPAKLFECVALGVPTLVIAEEKSASAREARRLGALTCESNDVEGIRAIVEQLWTGKIVPRDSRELISYEHIAAQMERVLTSDSL